MCESSPPRRSPPPPRFDRNGFFLAAATGATSSLAISLEDGAINRTEILRAAVAAAVAALAFAQSPNLPPAKR